VTAELPEAAGSVEHRLDGRVAIVAGAGQTAGETIGNGRATAILLARAGASVVCADRSLESAQETADMIEVEGGDASAFELEVTSDTDHASLVATTMKTHGRIDMLHNNVGVGVGDSTALRLDPDGFDLLWQINVKGMFLAARHVVPVIREQQSGSIVNISSMAAKHAFAGVGYKTTKVAVLGLTENLAAANTRHGIRVNAILPGLMNTPMAVEGRVALGTPRDEVIAQRDGSVPLGKKMGSAWDVANAALFLHSDEARFITGISLPVDGGMWVSS
jgi:NAD(P)-dependent dehydrogenase (short-subunit alcohol dehydrogenase family)